MFAQGVSGSDWGVPAVAALVVPAWRVPGTSRGPAAWGVPALAVPALVVPAWAVVPARGVSASARVASARGVAASAGVPDWGVFVVNVA